jgi:radical SAM superfamily enzyme YgiQ (UPF0313 family)
MADSADAVVRSSSTRTLLVRVDDGWALTPPGGRDPIPLDREGVLALLREGGRPPVSTVASEVLAAHLHPAAVVEPVSPFVLEVGRGCLVVERPGGDLVALDEVDVVLLDVLTEQCTVREVVDAVGEVLGSATPTDPELRGRMRRLVESIPLRLHWDPPADWQPPAEEPPASVLPARRARAVLRHVVPSGAKAAIRRRIAGEQAEAIEPIDGAEPLPVPHADAVPEASEHVDPAEPHSVVVDQPQVLSAEDAASPIVYLEDPVPAHDDVPGRIPVYAVWQVDVGPALSLGMLTASARQHDGGSLREHYEIRRPEDPGSFFADLARRTGPAILLCSNYVWSKAQNLELARKAKQLNPDLVIVHGGPSTPKYEGDAVRFFEEHDELVDVAVRGEGEITFVRLLEALAPTFPKLDADALAQVDGITFRHPESGEVIRTGERERVSSLDELPSPYLTGEYDHLHPDAWLYVTLETNRGCPYGCTFCDWGSSTLARIRKFEDERIAGEMEWAGERKFLCWALGDANFGITSRDVDTTELMVSVKERHGFPTTLGFNVAKNTTKHLTAIVDRLAGAGIAPVFSLALQTRDEDTLEAVRRQNISAEHYTNLAASLRRRSLPVQADLMIALPGQTVQSLSEDLQFLLDHEISGRMWITQLLPNAPINDPEYREEWQVRADERGLVVSTRSFTEADRDEMLRLRHAYTVLERFGVLRHLLRHLQWDAGLPAIAVQRRLLALADEQPTRYPLLSWMLHYFDFFNAPPLGWRSFMDELRRCLVVELGVEATSALDTVLQLQAFLLPAHGRRFPATIPLQHDYLAYYREQTAHLWGSDDVPTPRPLAEHGPATFTVYGDPLGRCGVGLQHIPDARNENMTDNFWMAGHWELDSPLVLDYADVSAAGTYIGVHEQIPADLPPEPSLSANSDKLAAVRVNLGSRQRADALD